MSDYVIDVNFKLNLLDLIDLCDHLQLPGNVNFKVVSEEILLQIERQVQYRTDTNSLVTEKPSIELQTILQPVDFDGNPINAGDIITHSWFKESSKRFFTDILKITDEKVIDKMMHEPASKVEFNSEKGYYFARGLEKKTYTHDFMFKYCKIVPPAKTEEKEEKVINKLISTKKLLKAYRKMNTPRGVSPEEDLKRLLLQAACGYWLRREEMTFLKSLKLIIQKKDKLKLTGKGAIYLYKSFYGDE